MRSLIHKHAVQDTVTVYTLNKNQLSLEVTVSLTHQRIRLLQFSNGTLSTAST